jgi:alkylation response protein AidB-like acyl-CoA dehydrogenase
MLSLSAEQEMIVRSLRDLAESEFAEQACEWQGEMPWENFRTLADNGFLGMEISEAYGGGGMTEMEALLLLEVVGRVCPDTAYKLASHNMIPSRAIDMFGSEALKAEYLPGLTAGEEAVITAISEPEAGSDVANMHTTAEDRDGDVVLNGEKLWVSGVPDARAAVVWVKFDEGMGSVVMDFDADGVEIGEHFTNMMGYTQTQFFMHDVVVPEEHVLVRGRDAFKKQLQSLNWERVFLAGMSNAVALCAMDHALEYAGDREQFGQPIGDFQGIEWKLADQAKAVELSRAYVHQLAQRAHETGDPPDRMAASIAKLHSAEMIERVVSEALQIHGANGYQQGHPLEYLYRFARARRIAGGTDEIVKNQIASVLKDEGLPHLA